MTLKTTTEEKIVPFAIMPPLLADKLLALKDKRININTRRNHRNALDAIKNELEKAIRDFDAKDH